MSKNKKKFQGQKVPLNEFLNEEGAPVQKGFQVVQKKDWSDDSIGSNLGQIVLPTAPISARGGNVDESKVPREPPYVAFLGNLPFELEEEEVANFFRELKLTNIRFAKDNSERPRGFGYAEFEDRKSLIEALGMDGEQLRNREIRVNLPNESENDSRGGYGRDRGMRSGGFGSRSERPMERDLPNDWRAAAREEQTSRGFDNYSRSDRYGGRDGGGGGGFGDRDRGGFGDRDRGGFGDRDRGSDDSRDWRNDNRDFSSRYEPARESNEPSSAPAERPKLKIAPRTKPVEAIKVTDVIEPEAEKKTEKPKIEKPKAADIFGSAKPVDTAAKLQEIEKRLEAKQKEEMEKAKQQEKAAEQQQQQQPASSSKETSPRHEQTDESSKMWRDEIRDEKEKKDKKQRSERRVPAQVVEEPAFNPTSKNKYAGLEVNENQDESGAEDTIEAEN